jgi:beta-glucosidase
VFEDDPDLATGVISRPAAGVATAPAVAAVAGSGAPWRDPGRPAAERVSDLMARMSLAEKLAQLTSIWPGSDLSAGQVAPKPPGEEPELGEQPELHGESELDGGAAPAGESGLDAHFAALVRHGIGQLTRIYGTLPVDPVRAARGLAEKQRTIMAAGQGIPALVHEECLTGLAAWQATVYPAPLSWGASFDPDLVRRMGAQIGAVLRRLGVHQGLAPVLDVARDLRWGRIEETIGEDPYLVGAIGSAYVAGLESAGIVATLKHFIGYSNSRSGRNHAPVSMGPREAADVILPPFEMALRAGARSVMNSYTDIDGVPVASDAGLLTGLLRETFRFEGTLVSDYFAVAFLEQMHAVAGSRGAAAALALAAGIDVELPAADCYGEPLLAEIEAGRVDAALVDRALERVLRQKCELGLLDPDWSPEAPILSESAAAGFGDRVEPLDDPRSRALAGELARRSIVLLSNRGAHPRAAATGSGDPVLPLRPGSRLAVVGPRAHVKDALFGCYSFPRHVGRHHPGLALGIEADTVLEALTRDQAGYEITYSRGCSAMPALEDGDGASGDEDEGIAAAVAAARDAEVCIAVLGDVSGLFGKGTSGEGCDALDLTLPGRQGELLDALLETGTPVVLVLLVGRPYELSRYADRLAAAVCAFLPGEAGAGAIADVLAGRAEPAGRLPVGFPGDGGGRPGGYLAAPLARRNEISNVDPTQLYPFGHGLSYNAAVWDGVELTEGHDTAWATDGWCRIAVRLRNAGTSETSEVVQVYLHDPVAEVARPVQFLVAAPRVDLPPGAERTVLIGVHADAASYTGRAGRRIVEPGDLELRVGASCADIRATLPVRMTGQRREIGFDREFQPAVRVIEA